MLRNTVGRMAGGRGRNEGGRWLRKGAAVAPGVGRSACGPKETAAGEEKEKRKEKKKRGRGHRGSQSGAAASRRNQAQHIKQPQRRRAVRVSGWPRAAARGWQTRQKDAPRRGQWVGRTVERQSSWTDGAALFPPPSPSPSPPKGPPTVGGGRPAVADQTRQALRRDCRTAQEKNTHTHIQRRTTDQTPARRRRLERLELPSPSLSPQARRTLVCRMMYESPSWRWPL